MGKRGHSHTCLPFWGLISVRTSAGSVSLRHFNELLFVLRLFSWRVVRKETTKLQLETMATHTYTHAHKLSTTTRANSLFRHV